MFIALGCSALLLLLRWDLVDYMKGSLLELIVLSLRMQLIQCRENFNSEIYQLGKISTL